MNLKRKLESLEKEIKNLTSPVNEEEKIVIIQLLAPLHKSDQVIFEDEENNNMELQFEPEEELSEREMEGRIASNEKKALEWLRANVDLRKCERTYVWVTPWEWLVQAPELEINHKVRTVLND
ncbi:hypothetical protein [Desulfurobacterium crinifex]